MLSGQSSIHVGFRVSCYSLFFQSTSDFYDNVIKMFILYMYWHTKVVRFYNKNSNNFSCEIPVSYNNQKIFLNCVITCLRC